MIAHERGKRRDSEGLGGKLRAVAFEQNQPSRLMRLQPDRRVDIGGHRGALAGPAGVAYFTGAMPPVPPVACERLDGSVVSRRHLDSHDPRQFL